MVDTFTAWSVIGLSFTNCLLLYLSHEEVILHTERPKRDEYFFIFFTNMIFSFVFPLIIPNEPFAPEYGMMFSITLLPILICNLVTIMIVQILVKSKKPYSMMKTAFHIFLLYAMNFILFTIAIIGYAYVLRL